MPSMIVQRRQMSVVNVVLMFFSTFVLVMHMTAAESTRQIVHVSGPDDLATAYWASPNQSELSTLRHRLQQYAKPKQHRALGVNEWIAETSRIYSQNAEALWTGEQKSSIVQRVSHRQMPSETLPELSRNELRGMAAAGWSRISDAAEQRVRQIEEHQTRRLSQLPPLPVELGPVVSSPWTLESAMMAVTAATVVVLGLMLWNWLTPAWVFHETMDGTAVGDDSVVTQETVSQETVTQYPPPRKFGVQAENDDSGGDDWMPIHISQQWIRVHQTLGCRCRRVVMGMLSIAAVACAALSMTSL